MLRQEGPVVPLSFQISVFLLTLMRNNKLPLSESTWHRIAVSHHPIIITFFILRLAPYNLTLIFLLPLSPPL